MFEWRQIYSIRCISSKLIRFSNDIWKERKKIWKFSTAAPGSLQMRMYRKRFNHHQKTWYGFSVFMHSCVYPEFSIAFFYTRVKASDERWRFFIKVENVECSKSIQKKEIFQRQVKQTNNEKERLENRISIEQEVLQTIHTSQSSVCCVLHIKRWIY